MRWLYIIGFALLFWIAGSTALGVLLAVAVPGVTPVGLQSVLYLSCLGLGGFYGDHLFTKKRVAQA